MKIETFNYLWKEGIAKAASNVYGEIDQKEKKEFGVKIDISDAMCQRVYDEYQEIKTYVREKFFNTGETNENKIDGHKICACITGALLRIRLISFKFGNGDVPKKIVYSNYAVAFLAAIHVMYLFLLSDYEKAGNMDCYNRLKERATFDFPETTPGHDSYVHGRIKTLVLNDMYGIDFDVLTYADMLYWIEKYNKDLLCK